MQVKVYDITWGETQTTTGAIGGSVVTYSISFSDQGVQGQTGPQGPIGEPNTLSIGTITTSAPGGNAAASVTGVAPNQVLSLTIPRGEPGPTGPANTLAIGTVTTGSPGSSAVATISGTAPNQTLDLTIPRGDPGELAGSIPWDSVTDKPSTFSPSVHTHVAADVTDFATAVAAVSPPVDWNSLTGKPSTFPPEAHTHTFNEVNDAVQIISGESQIVLDAALYNTFVIEVTEPLEVTYDNFPAGRSINIYLEAAHSGNLLHSFPVETYFAELGIDNTVYSFAGHTTRLLLQNIGSKVMNFGEVVPTNGDPYYGLGYAYPYGDGGIGDELLEEL